MGISIQQTSVELIPTGEYTAVIKKIEEVTGQFGPQLKFGFELTAPDQAGRQISDWVSMVFNPKSKLYLLTKAAFGGSVIPEDYNFNSDDIMGRKLILVIAETPKKQDPSTIINKINLYKGIPKAKPANGTAKPVPSFSAEAEAA